MSMHLKLALNQKKDIDKSRRYAQEDDISGWCEKTWKSITYGVSHDITDEEIEQRRNDLENENKDKSQDRLTKLKAIRNWS